MSEVKTVAEKVAALCERAAALLTKANELEQREANAAALASVAVGDVVSFKLGRAETRREVSGQVLFRGVVDGVDVVRVLSGEGAEVAVNQVKVADLTGASKPQAEPEAEEAPVLAQPAEAEQVQIG